MGFTDVLLVAHGERGGRGNRSLRSIAASVQTSLAADRPAGGLRVHAGVLKGEPSLESAVAVLQGGSCSVYPLFMADGYLTRTALPERLGLSRDGRDRAGRRFTRLAPFGLDPGLAGAVIGFATDALGGEVDPGACDLLLAAHGARESGASAFATESLRDRLLAAGLFADVHAGFLENPPFLDVVCAGLGRSRRCVVVGLFVGEGLHAVEDVPQALSRAEGAHFVHAGPIGTSPAAGRIVERAVRAALSGRSESPVLLD